MKYNAFTKDELITLIELRDKQIREKNSIIERLNDNAELRDEVVTKRNNQIVELNNTIRDLTEKHITKDKLIKKYKKTITDNENNLSLKNDRIQELEMTVKDVKAQRDAARYSNCNSGRYPCGPKPGRLSDQINLIEKRLNAIENYIFGGNKND